MEPQKCTCATGEAPAGEGRLCHLAEREEQQLGCCLDGFLQAWRAADLPRALVAFAWFREAMNRHMRWEEESLFEEVEKRAAVPELRRVRAHHLQHEAIGTLADRIHESLERSLSIPAPADAALTADVAALESLVHAHRKLEHDEVCQHLDAVLEEPAVKEIESELEERGRI